MHDKLGKPIKIGDRVIVEFTVEDASTNPDFCNLMVKTVEPFYPDPNRRDAQWINAKQCLVLDETTSIKITSAEGSKSDQSVNA